MPDELHKSETGPCRIITCANFISYYAWSSWSSIDDEGQSDFGQNRMSLYFYTVMCICLDGKR